MNRVQNVKLSPEAKKSTVTASSTSRLDQIANNLKAAAGPVKEKRVKADGMPKRPLSAYNLFFQQVRREMLGDQYQPPSPDKSRRKHRKSHGKIGFAEMARVISQKWKALDPSMKERLQERAAENKEEYLKDVELYRAKKQIEEIHAEKGRPASPRTQESAAALASLGYSPGNESAQQQQGMAFAAIPSLVEGRMVTPMKPTAMRAQQGGEVVYVMAAPQQAQLPMQQRVVRGPAPSAAYYQPPQAQQQQQIIMIDPRTQQQFIVQQQPPQQRVIVQQQPLPGGGRPNSVMIDPRTQQQVVMVDPRTQTPQQRMMPPRVVSGPAPGMMQYAQAPPGLPTMLPPGARPRHVAMPSSPQPSTASGTAATAMPEKNGEGIKPGTEEESGSTAAPATPAAAPVTATAGAPPSTPVKRASSQPGSPLATPAVPGTPKNVANTPAVARPPSAASHASSTAQSAATGARSMTSLPPGTVRLAPPPSHASVPGAPRQVMVRPPRMMAGPAPGTQQQAMYQMPAGVAPGPYAQFVMIDPRVQQQQQPQQQQIIMVDPRTNQPIGPPQVINAPAPPMMGGGFGSPPRPQRPPQQQFQAPPPYAAQQQQYVIMAPNGPMISQAPPQQQQQPPQQQQQSQVVLVQDASGAYHQYIARQ